MQYIELTFAPLTEEQQEILIASLSAFEHVGMEEIEVGIKVYFEADCFPEDAIREAAAQLGLSFTKALLPYTNWNKEWEQNFEPVRIGDFCYVRARFHPSISGLKHDIVITPKMSFGTGHHATTEMMIASMEGLHIRNKQVFDFGTGTGILAILSEKMGAAKIWAADLDTGAVSNAEENAEFNRCSKVEFVFGSVEMVSKRRFDVILANINRNTLLHYMPDFSALLTENGQLLLSGILKEDVPYLLQSAEAHNLELVTRRFQKEWACLLLKKC